jgi:hypothetical protein
MTLSLLPLLLSPQRTHTDFWGTDQLAGYDQPSLLLRHDRLCQGEAPTTVFQFGSPRCRRFCRRNRRANVDSPSKHATFSFMLTYVYIRLSRGIWHIEFFSFLFCVVSDPSGVLNSTWTIDGARTLCGTCKQFIRGRI